MTPESILKEEVTKYLKQTNRFFLRLNSGKTKVRGGWMQLCPTGTPDLVVFDAGRVLWIELKVDWKETKEQREFHTKALYSGHEHTICKSLNEVIAFLEA